MPQRTWSANCRAVGIVLLLVVSCALAACASHRRTEVAAPAAPAAAVDAPARVAAADDLVRRGCYDCLVEALQLYEGALSGRDDQQSPVREGAVRTAALLAVRETELGLKSGGYIDRARRLLGPVSTASPDVAGVVEIAEVIVSGPAGQSRVGETDSQIASMLTIARSREQWASVLGNLIPQDLTAAYLWTGLACGQYAAALPDRERRREVLAPIAAIPLIQYKEATACGVAGPEPFEALLAAEPRFGELEYALGLYALGGQTGRTPDLDLADRHFSAAYQWRQEWPSLTLAIGNVAMSAEDFPRALEFYGRTLALSPDNPDALAGTLRALTYADRQLDAVKAADRLLATGHNPGEAHYWRALNLARLKRDAEAWADIEQASTALANAEVPKLAGIIAINRRDVGVARDRLELARRRRPSDCETSYYLQSVLAEQRDWEPAAQVAADAGNCFDAEEGSLQQDLATARASQMAPEHRARVIARLEQQLASDARMRATVWYNAAAANFNLARTDEARRFAEKVADDEQFGERARVLLQRIK